jgi:hypothetical protein
MLFRPKRATGRKKHVTKLVVCSCDGQGGGSVLTDVVLDADIDNVNDRVQIISTNVHQVDYNNEKARR